MLDHHRALLHAGAAGAAGPERLVADHLADHLQLCDGADVAARVPASLDLRPDLREVRLEVLDQVHRRERLPGDVGGTDLRAASAAHAGVEFEELLPGEVLDLADAEDLLLLDVLDFGEAAGGVGAQQEGVDGREDHVVEAREDQHPQPGEGEQDVAPPHPGVARQRLRLREIEDAERLGDEVGDEGPARPVRMRRQLRAVLQHEAVQLRDADPQRLDHEAGDEDQPEAPDDRVVLEALVPADAVEVVEVAAVERHAHADQPDQAEQVAVEGEEQVVAAVQEAERRVVVDRDLRGDGGEHDDRRENAEVHDPGVAVAPHLLLAEAEAQRVARPHRDLAQQSRGGLADGPERGVANEAVDQQPDQPGEQDVDDPGLLDVEEDLAAGVRALQLDRRDQAEAAEADGRSPPGAREPDRAGLATTPVRAVRRGRIPL